MRYFIYLILLIGLVGCGPKYKIYKEYVSPKGSNDSVCLSQCQQKKSRCDFECKARYDVCLGNARNAADRIYAQEKVRYNEDYRRYERDLARYNEDKRLKKSLKKDRDYFLADCKKGTSYACERYHNSQNALDKLNSKYTPYPLSPNRPRIADILENEQNKCDSKCDCEQNFDICFGGCGGKVITHKVCIENCEQ